MTHEQLQAAQRAALALDLNINSEQAAAIINAALRAEQDLTHCACGDAYPATSYDAGFIDGSGMCQNCDASIPAKDIHTPAARDVLAERQRQVDTEGWTPEHDDKHGAGELADAAACYALWAGGINPGNWREFWPWAPEWLKHSEPRRMLVKAGALIQAEIERLDRAANKEPSHG